MQPTCLTVLAPIRPGEEEALGGILRATGDDIKGERHRGRRARSAHRLPAQPADSLRAVRDTATIPIAARAARACSSRRVTTAISTITWPSWSQRPPTRTRSGAAARATAGPPPSARSCGARARPRRRFYIAFRDESCRVDSARARRRRAHAAAAGRRRALGADPPSAAGGSGTAAGPPADRRGRRPRAGAVRVRATSTAARSASSRASTAIPFFRVVNLLTRNRMPARRVAALERDARPLRRARAARPGRRGPGVPPRWPPGFREDVVVQNQLTLVTVIGPGSADRVRAVMSAIDSYATAARAARIAHRHQHDSFRALARHRQRPPADDGERLRRLVGELHRRVRRDDPLGTRRHLGNGDRRIRRTARGTCRRSSASCARTRCRRTCSSAPIPTRRCSTSSDTTAASASDGGGRSTCCSAEAPAPTSKASSRAAMGICRLAAYLFVRVADAAGGAARGSQRSRPSITTARRWPIGTDERAERAGRPPSTSASPQRVCARAGCRDDSALHVPAGVSGRHRDARALARSSVTRRRARPIDVGVRRSGRRPDSRARHHPRAGPTPSSRRVLPQQRELLDRQTGGVVTSCPGSIAAWLPARRRLRAVRVPRRHLAAEDPGHHRQRRPDRRVHPRLRESLRTDPADAGGSGRARSARRCCRRSTTRTTPARSCAISAATARSSSTASCSRTSPGSGGSCATKRCALGATADAATWCGSRPSASAGGRAARRSRCARTPTIRGRGDRDDFRLRRTIRTGSPARSARTCVAPPARRPQAVSGRSSR